ncbi:MAG TPA: phosphatase PAP2 family protein [Candidatus Saccharimonadales bacterium]|nr:phosphatase PAP2 family protein [Candidatus Saccharimonadales bacterium]
MDTVIRSIATYFIVIPIGGIGYVAITQKRQARLELLFVLVVGGGLSLLLALVGSHFYHNPRPFVVGHFTPLIAHGTDNGFPSDHTLLSAFLAFVAFSYSRKLGASLLFVAVLIGSARMAAGVHHLSDVVGSICFAGLSCLAAVWLKNRLFKKSAATRESLKPAL